MFLRNHQKFQINGAVLADDLISSYHHGGFYHVHLYQGSILSRRNTCRDYGSEAAALSMGVHIFYKRDNIHPGASFVFVPFLLLLWLPAAPHPWQPLNCLGMSSRLGQRRGKGSPAFQKLAVEGPVETHGFALDTSDGWILPMQADMLTRVCPWVCPRSRGVAQGDPAASQGISQGMFLLLPSPAALRDSDVVGLKPLSRHEGKRHLLWCQRAALTLFKLCIWGRCS